MTLKSFEFFTALWNAQQRKRTPLPHFRIAKWLGKATQEQQKRLLIMAFRACGKSTMIGLYAAWKLSIDPNVRIMVISADEILAGKMVRQVKRIMERHVLTKHLKPPMADQWGIDRFTVLRDQELRDPSMIARGITGNLTGSRADIIILDDVEVPNTCDTTEKRRNLRERLAETDFILVPGGIKIYVGTPHTYHSLYSETPGEDHEDEGAFLNNYHSFHLPILSENGASNWSDRYPLSLIEQMRLDTGPNKFESQMMLRPVNITNGRLNPDFIKIYDGELAYMKELAHRLEINNTPMDSAAAWWDPAFGKSGGDRSVLAICFRDHDSHYWLHHLEVMTQDKSHYNETEDHATAQCRAVAECLKKYRVPCVSLETNGIGRFLPSILRKELRRLHVPCSVREIHQSRPKDIRILDAFDVVLAAGRLHVHTDVMRTPFATEIREWRPNGRGHDDCLDAVAGALSAQAVRLGSHPPVGQQIWQKTAQSHDINSHFSVF